MFSVLQVGLLISYAVKVFYPTLQKRSMRIVSMRRLEYLIPIWICMAGSAEV